MQLTASEPPSGPSRGEVLRFVLKALFVLGAVVLIVWWTARNPLAASLFERGGWPALFLMSVASGFNLLVPVPVISFLPAILDAGFGLVPAVLVIASGMAVGDMIGYAIGFFGRSLAPPTMSRFTLQVEGMIKTSPWLSFGLLVIWAAFVPLPNEILVLPMAYFGYSMWRIVSAVVVGNVVFNSLSAYAVLMSASLIG